ncbi:MAG: hypothetical protein ACLFQB_08430 [Chitinispirillaceae bacterium]
MCKNRVSGFKKAMRNFLISSAILFLLGCTNHTMRHYLEPQPSAQTGSDSLKVK